MANILTDPPFAADPPIKLNIPAKTLGLIAAVLGGIGLLLGLLALPAVFALNHVCTAFNGLGIANTCNSGSFGVAIIGVIIALAGAALYAFGGYRMYQGIRQGKDLVIYGLAVNVVGGIVEGVGYSGFGGVFISLIVAVVIYYLVVISRWPDEAPLVASMMPPGGYGSPPPPPPPSPPSV